MILRQYYLGCLAHASYLVADPAAGVAAVIDPQRDVEQYLRDAAAQGVRIAHVFLTHFHADFVAGHLELQQATGARIHLGARGQAEYAFEPARDGDRIDLGPGVRLEILETPGHTPEGISILVYDLAKSSGAPHAVLTGDTLFIGDVGRPDLMASVGITAEELAGMLYDSLHHKLLPLPDEVIVYPAHGAGSMCGKNLSRETFSTLGAQRKYNYALQPMAREEFIRVVTADQMEAPAYFAFDAELNKKQRPTLEAALERSLRPLSVDEVRAAQAAGAHVVDTRDAADWAGAHWTGSVNIGLGGQFASWAGTLLDRTRHIVIIAEPGRETEAATRLGRIGFDHVLGALAGGMAAVAGTPELVRTSDRIAAAVLAERLASGEPPWLLDVRNPGEFQRKRIEGAVLVPLGQLERRVHEIPLGRPVVVHCASGYRSGIAQSLLEQRGIVDAAELIGGLAAWEKSALPLLTTPV